MRLAKWDVKHRPVFMISDHRVQSSGGPLSGAPGSGKLTNWPPAVFLQNPSLRSLKTGMLTIAVTQAELSFKVGQNQLCSSF